MRGVKVDDLAGGDLVQRWGASEKPQVQLHSTPAVIDEDLDWVTLEFPSVQLAREAVAILRDAFAHVEALQSAEVEQDCKHDVTRNERYSRTGNVTVRCVLCDANLGEVETPDSETNGDGPMPATLDDRVNAVLYRLERVEIAVDRLISFGATGATQGTAAPPYPQHTYTLDGSVD